jgi:4'-phosphopantetheinyl transferase
MAKLMPDMWHRPTAPPPLPDDELHLWRVALPFRNVDSEGLERALTEDERESAARFRFERDRNRFIGARSALRQILANYVGQSPERLRFRYSSTGKPALDASTVGRTLSFNVSHSHDVAVVAVSRRGEVGVDVERISPIPDMMAVAARMFSAGELDAIRSLPAPERVEAFFACWTRKEAYVKATGGGLSVPLDRFEMAVTPGRPAALLRHLDDPAEPSRWTVQAFSPWPQYAGAVVAPAAERPLVYRLFDARVV